MIPALIVLGVIVAFLLGAFAGIDRSDRTWVGVVGALANEDRKSPYEWVTVKYIGHEASNVTLVSMPIEMGTRDDGTLVVMMDTVTDESLRFGVMLSEPGAILRIELGRLSDQ